MDGNKYTFHSLFTSAFEISNRDLGREAPSGDTLDRERFLEEKVSVGISEILIPRSQRDYAQGRTSANIKRIRNDFVRTLYESLSSGTPCVLNFVYGQLRERNAKSGRVSFIPLDGQQRLTTLYLLHWYVSRHEDCAEQAKYLGSFSYETRYSSSAFTTTFLRKIENLKIDQSEVRWFEKELGFSMSAGDALPYVPGDSGNGILSAWLKNKSDFSASWSDDPTIAGMLVTLDTIHEFFHHTSNLWGKLVADTCPISFFFTYVDRNADAGDAFIKMNSRGKLLSEYEYFKADFQKIVKERYDKSADLFKRMDNEWDVSLWRYVKAKESAGFKTSDIDCYLIRWVNSVLETLLVRDGIMPCYSEQQDVYDASKLRKWLDASKPDFKNRVDEFVSLIECWLTKNGFNVGTLFDACLTYGMPADWKTVRLYIDEKSPIPDSVLLRNRRLTIDDNVFLYGIITAIASGLLGEPDGIEIFKTRFRLLQNLCVPMEKSAGEYRYLLKHAKRIMAYGAVDGFVSEGDASQRFTEKQITEERAKRLAIETDPSTEAIIRTIEMQPYFQGQISIFAAEFQDPDITGAQASVVCKTVLPKRYEMFKRVVSNAKPDDQTLRDALFWSQGKSYAVLKKGTLYWGATQGDNCTWLRERHPYFTEKDNALSSAFVSLMSSPLLSELCVNNPLKEGSEILKTFVMKKRSDYVPEEQNLDYDSYYRKYYDSITELWRTDFKDVSQGKEMILSGRAVPLTQVLSRKRRSAVFWDPIIIAIIAKVDPLSCNDASAGKFSHVRRFGSVSDFTYHKRTHIGIANGADSFILRGRSDDLDEILSSYSGEVGEKKAAGNVTDVVDVAIPIARDNGFDKEDRVEMGVELCKLIEAFQPVA